MVLDVAAWRGKLSPERPAVRWRGRWYSYGELDERAGRVARRLHAEGVREGDRVAILAHNHLAHLDLMLAAPRLGFICAPLNHRVSAAEQKALCSELAPALLLHDRANADKAAATGVRLLPLERYGDWLAKSAPELPARTPREGDIHMLLLTGGSTGLPKAAQLTYRQVATNAANTVECWGLTGEDCAIQATPAFHAAVHVLTTPLLHAGGRVIWTEAFDPAEYLHLVQQHGVTVLFMVPTMFQMLAEHPDFASADLSRVRWAITGGAPCPPAVREAHAARGVPFKVGYGMTECGVNCFAMSNEEAAAHPDSVGRPMPGLSAVVRDPDGAPLPAGAVGELTLSGALVCDGYFRKPAETAAAFRDGWLWTGDLARVDAQGLYYICGRRKDMFISGGENVYPAEVEAALSQCRGVSECAVIGIPHARWGETGLAAVSARPGTRLSADLLRTELKARLAGYKVPTEFLFLEALPKTGAGKIAKSEIRRLHDSGRSAA